MFRRILIYLGFGFAALTVVGIGAGVAYLVTVTSGLPSVDSLRHYEPRITTRVYAGNGTVLGEYARERRIFVPIEFVPNRVKQAFTSAEDRNFYNHPGVDPSGILRAAIKDVSLVIQRRRPQGASTITQQVARIFLLNSDLKFSRKIREAILAVRIDATYPKDKVLELYLNEIYLGGNSYGVAAAALNYFGKSLDELTIAEVAFLAALPKGPANYDPRRYHDAAVERRNWVIDQMVENRHVTRAEAAAAKAEPLLAQSRPMGSQAADVDYYVEQVRRQLYARYGQNELYDGGLQVRASLDTRLQNYAVSALRSGLVRYDRRHGWRGAKQNISIAGDWKKALAAVPSRSGVESWRLAVVLGSEGRSIRIGFSDGTTSTIPFEGYRWARRQLANGVGAVPSRPEDVAKAGDLVYVEALAADPKAGIKAGEFGLRQVPEVNGAIVAMDPHTGRVLAMSGGFSYASSEFDRAMQAMRQPGSTFKPFVYAAALDNGYTPATKVLDAPFELDMGPGQGIWRPENFEVGDYLGETPLRRGLELSHNLMTVRLAWQLGMDKVAPLAEHMGVYPKLPHFLANSLGSQDTTLMRMVAAYAGFVNGGKKIQPSLVDRIQDRNGKTIWRHDTRKCEGCNLSGWTSGQEEPLLADPREQVIDARTAYQVVSMLEGVVQRGTAVSLRAIGKPVAGKTGTSNEARNLWFVGFSPDLVAGVYVGFDNNRSLGRSEQASQVASPIFRDFMTEALKDSPAIPFRVAPGIELVSIDRFSGQPSTAPGSIMEAFKAGTAPGDYFGPEPFSPEPSQASTGSTGTTTTQSSAPPAAVGEGTGGLY